MAKDVNDKELKVGDKVKALEDWSRTKKGNVYTVWSLENCEGDYMGVWLENGDYMSKWQIKLVEDGVPQGVLCLNLKQVLN